MGFLLLGTLGVEVGTHVCRIGSGPQRVILAALLLKPNQVVSAEHLTTLIWYDMPPAGPRQALNNHVMRLRKALGPAAAERIRTQSPGYAGYAIEVRPGELDLHRFDAMQQDADTAISAGDWTRAAGLLDSALALWRGDALTDIPSRQLQLEAQEHLAERRFRAQQARVDALLHLGRFDEAIGHVRHLMTDRPLDEGLPGRLMAALYGSGRQSDALAAFQRIRDTLDDELGIEPGRELRELHRAVLTQ